MLAVGTAKPSCHLHCVSASPQDKLKVTAPYMGARRVKQSVLRRLYQGSTLKQSPLQDTMTETLTGEREEKSSSAWLAKQQTVMRDS